MWVSPLPISIDLHDKQGYFFGMGSDIVLMRYSRYGQGPYGGVRSGRPGYGTSYDGYGHGGFGFGYGDHIYDKFGYH